MSSPPPSSKPAATPTAPIGMIVTLCFAALLYVVMLAWIAGSRDSDAAGRGLAGVYILGAAFLLWILLGVLLLIGAARGRMPLGATLAAVVMLPGSAIGVVEALDLYGRDVDLMIVVPALVPVVFAAYAAWARFPSLQAWLGPLAASSIAGIIVVALTALPFAVKAYEERPNPERDSRLAAEAKARQEAEEKQYREQLEKEATDFAKLGPESSLMDYIPFLAGNFRNKAAAGMKKVKSRQADTVMLLQKKGLDGTPNLMLLDVQASPELCQAYGGALSSAAGQISKAVRSDYITAAIKLEYEMSTVEWLTAHDCNLDEPLTLAATNIRAIADSDRLRRLADRLEALRRAK